MNAFESTGCEWDYPSNKPERIEEMPGGGRRVFMAEGESLTLPRWPCYLLEYESRWSTPEKLDWYTVPISMTGRLIGNGYFYESWNFDKDERRCYRFDKTVRLMAITASVTLTGEEHCKILEGRAEQPFPSHPGALADDLPGRMTAKLFDKSPLQVNAMVHLPRPETPRATQPTQILPQSERWHEASMPDGERINLPPWPCYRLEYLRAAATPEDLTCDEFNISLTGRVVGGYFYEAWNFDLQQRICYRFDRTVRLNRITAPRTLTGLELREMMFGSWQEGLIEKPWVVMGYKSERSWLGK
jgi:hypothetical protein